MMNNRKKQNFYNNPAYEKRSHMNAIEERFPLHEQNENAQMCNYSEQNAIHPEKALSFDRLSQTTVDGFPIYIDRNSSNMLEATFHGNTHALIIGSTGSGKTTGFVLPFLHWECNKKNKPTIIISDPKDELKQQTVGSFIKNGYDVKWFNFRDYSVSDGWNPLTKFYRLYQLYLHIEDEITVVFEDGKAYNAFEGVVFKSQALLDTAVYAKKDKILADIDGMIGSFSESISPVDKDSDPYWDHVSATWIRGFLWAMLEDSDPKKEIGRITEETYNMNTLINIYDTFSNQEKKVDDRGYFSKRDPETSRAYQLVESSIIELTASSTRACIISCFNEKIKPFRDTSIRRITSATSIDIDGLDDNEKPTVIFISYKDEDSLHYNVISLFISDLYTSLIGSARRSGGKLKRPCYFMLDEFGNFPKFKDFEHVISACRSRNIWFLLVVQSYAQLYRVYEKETAEIIIDNLNIHLFYGSCNYETKEAFSKECGMHEVTSSLSAINGEQKFIENFNTQLVPLVPVSRLNQLKEGECIITQMKGDIIWSKVERSYLCPEYNVNSDIRMTREPPIQFYDEKYRYDVNWIRKGCVQTASKFTLHKD